MSLIKLFLILSIFAVVQMCVFRAFGGLSFMEGLPLYAKYSFGNMGFTKAICGKSPIQNAEIDEGTIPKTSIFF